jgi:hypothetical protein
MRAAIVAGHRKERPMAVTKEDIVARASSMAFGKSLIMNVLRAMILETIVDSALSLDWKWCSTDEAYPAVPGISVPPSRALRVKTATTGG